MEVLKQSRPWLYPMMQIIQQQKKKELLPSQIKKALFKARLRNSISYLPMIRIYAIALRAQRERRAYEERRKQELGI